MDEANNHPIASELITQNILSYLIRTGVVNKDDYIEYTELLKNAIIKNFQNKDVDRKELSIEIITDIFDKHLEFTRGN